MSETAETTILEIEEKDREWIRAIMAGTWGSSIIISRGKKHLADRYPGFIAKRNNRNCGFAVYEIIEGQCELVAMRSLMEGEGIGTLLLKAVEEKALQKRCRRLWLVTTNDNIPALEFYGKRGFRQVAVHKDAVTGYRKLKPEIPLYGHGGIPIRDEIELEIDLGR